MLAIGETIEMVTGQIGRVSLLCNYVAFIAIALWRITCRSYTDVFRAYWLSLFVMISFGLAETGGFSGLHKVLDPSFFNLSAPKEMTCMLFLCSHSSNVRSGWEPIFRTRGLLQSTWYYKPVLSKIAYSSMTTQVSHRCYALQGLIVEDGVAKQSKLALKFWRCRSGSSMEEE